MSFLQTISLQVVTSSAAYVLLFMGLWNHPIPTRMHYQVHTLVIYMKAYNKQGLSHLVLLDQNTLYMQ
jgi:hypothetical protein